MAKVSMVSAFALLILVASVMVVGSHAGMTCRTVVDSLMPCRTYLRRGGNLPSSCCNGVRSLNGAANSPSARKTACWCIKFLARAYRVRSRYAGDLPSRCNVNIGYPISYRVNCNNVR